MSDDFDYDAEAVRAFVDILRGIAQARAIARAELALLDTPDAYPIPMPDEAHHSFSRHAEFVRRWPTRDAVRLPLMRRPGPAETSEEATYPTATLASNTITLTSQKVCAPAPFVGRRPGDEAMYFWLAWSDGSSRYITTAAELVWR